MPNFCNETWQKELNFFLKKQLCGTTTIPKLTQILLDAQMTFFVLVAIFVHLIVTNTWYSTANNVLYWGFLLEGKYWKMQIPKSNTVYYMAYTSFYLWNTNILHGS